MATEKTTLLDTAVASVDLSGSQYRLVKIDASEELALCVAGDLGYSLQDHPVAGESGTVALGGKANVVAGGVIAAGDRLTSDANAAAVVATATDTVGNIDGDIFSLVALEAGVVGQIIEALVAFGRN